jgi:hypothetical protein
LTLKNAPAKIDGALGSSIYCRVFGIFVGGELMHGRLFVAALTFVALCCAPSSEAALLRYEPFDYNDVGATVEGKTNPDGETWVAAYGNSTAPGLIKITSGSLGMPAGMSPPIGNSVEIDGGPSSVGTNPFQNGKALRLPLDDDGATVAVVNGGDTVYYSLALRIDELTGATNTTGGFFIGLNNTGDASTANPGSVAARLQARVDPTDGTKYNLGIVRNRATTAADIPWSGPLTVGETLFVVASIELVPGTQNDVARLWINPDASTFRDPSFPSPTLADDTVGIGTIGTDIGIASIILRQSPAPHVTVDELRVGTDWRSVTIPEPTTCTLMLIGAVMMLSRRRK